MIEGLFQQQMDMDFGGGAGLVFLTLVFFLIFFAAGYGLYRFARFVSGKGTAVPKKPNAPLWAHKKRNNNWRRKRRFRPRKGDFALACLIIFFGLLINSQSQKDIGVFEGQAEHEKVVYTENTIICSDPYILDGDTLTCDGVRIRLYGIDAPEMPGHCKPGRRCAPGNPHKSKKHLQNMTRGEVVCQRIEIDHYGRTIARCTAQGQDVSCAMVAAKQAIRRYGNLTCP